MSLIIEIKEQLIKHGFAFTEKKFKSSEVGAYRILVLNKINAEVTIVPKTGCVFVYADTKSAKKKVKKILVKWI